MRLAYPLSDVESVQTQVRRRLLWGSLVAFLVAMLIAGTASVWTSRRLERIVDVAARIERGDLRARVDDSPMDEIGRVAVAIDRSAEQVERSFAAVRSSQRQLETLLNSMQDAVIAVSSEGLVRWANQPMDRLVPQRTRLNAPVVETIRDPDFLATVKAATSSKEVKTGRATSIVPGRAFDVTAAPLPDGGVVAVLRDLTETERVEKTRRDFIANVSHELRTPLTSIQGYTETLLDTLNENSGSTREFLEIIRKNTTRMARLTEDLLTLARVESGETRFETEPVPPVELLHDAEESFREVARGHGVELQIMDVAQREWLRRVPAAGSGRPRSHPPGLFKPDRQRYEVRTLRCAYRTRRPCRGDRRPRPSERHRVLCSVISEPASPPSIFPASSSASTASIKPAPANPGVPDLALPSPSTSCAPTVAPSAQTANSATAAPSPSPSPPHKSCAENLSRERCVDRSPVSASPPAEPLLSRVGSCANHHKSP